MKGDRIKRFRKKHLAGAFARRLREKGVSGVTVWEMPNSSEKGATDKVFVVNWN